MKNFQYYLERVSMINEETMSGKEALKQLEKIVKERYDGSINADNRKEFLRDSEVLELIIGSIAPDAQSALKFAREYFNAEGWGVSAKFFRFEDRDLTAGVALKSIASDPKTAFEYLSFIPNGWHEYFNSPIYKDYPEIPQMALNTIKKDLTYKNKYEKLFPGFDFNNTNAKLIYRIDRINADDAFEELMSSYKKDNIDDNTKMLLESIIQSPKKCFKFLFKNFRSLLDKKSNNELTEKEIPEPKEQFRKVFNSAMAYYQNPRN